jgi:hypothetical protein
MRFLLAACSLGLLGGCALIVNGTTDSVQIESQPPGATIAVDGKPVARTPAKIYVARAHVQRITVQKDGYEPQDVFFNRHLDWGFILFDLLLTAGIGIPIDLATGAMVTIYPDRAQVRLRPKPQ